MCTLKISSAVKNRKKQAESAEKVDVLAKVKIGKSNTYANALIKINYHLHTRVYDL